MGFCMTAVRVAGTALAFILIGASATASDVQVAFSPRGGAADLVIKTVSTANEDIRVAAYVITSASITTALIQADRRGVSVRVVVDGREATRGSTTIGRLKHNGIEVRTDYRYAMMHDKFIIVDDQTVEEGSFNYTAAAESRNAGKCSCHTRSQAGGSVRARVEEVVGRINSCETLMREPVAAEAANRTSCDAAPVASLGNEHQ
jgi:phosphatidylserine/phosphatidylglycerophosphate/cardiolipin synthase-like enzyme